MKILCKHLETATAFSPKSWLQQPHHLSDNSPTLSDTLRLHAQPHLTDSEEFDQLLWKTYLAGEDTPFRLDLAESNAFLHPKANHISQTFNVDSLIMHVHNVTLFKEGFNISSYSSFIASVTSNIHIKINGLSIHQTHHLCLGHSAFRFTFPLYILFLGWR